ncbi:hypothetical protein CBR_g38539 [Chara braunii]|uniref:Protein CASP n=1 Tax=Chara braunii TaxID=69332 RepID=A0A388JP04_CHABU|nr:hypothetical protein CBR_g38539 [Chara braunii]|eukprot:GBG59515.1 hypothetical protein CBR_g38539 [Chara braunii]
MMEGGTMEDSSGGVVMTGGDVSGGRGALPRTSPAMASFSPSSPISVVLSYWKELDLERMKVKLDEQGLKIAEYQESSLKNRRKLAESTRDFKRADQEEKARQYGPLLKAYQEEVDSLTKRAKFSENAFLTLYQKLYEAPDPVPALAPAAEASARVMELEQENRKFRQELEEFRAEAANLRNQQVTVRRLEERNRQLEQRMEEKVKEMVELKQRAMSEENQKSLETLKEREELLHEQLRAAKESVHTMRRLHEYGQRQLFQLRAKSDEDREAKQSELNLLTEEVDRAQSRLTSLEREKEALKAQLQAMTEKETEADGDSGGGDGGAVRAAEESLAAAREKVISELHAELQRMESALAAEREKFVLELKKLHLDLDEKEKMVASLKEELAARPTPTLVEDLKKQIKILQMVGYNSVEAEDWELATRGEEIGKLETLLLEKNRKLEHDLTQARLQIGERTKEVAAAQARVKELEAVVEKQRGLIAKLEEDILKGYGAMGERRGGSSWRDDWGEGGAGFDEREAISNALQQGRGGGVGGAAGGRTKAQGGEEEDDHSVLAVVCGQRDRFKQRMNELEEELRRVLERVKVQALELERSKSDNVKLYEKIRFVQEYQNDRMQSRGGGRMSKRGSVGDVESGLPSDVETKYKKLYEDDINPFAAFSKKERDQRYRDLGLRDRITLTSGRFLLGNKYARTFVFFYSVSLHIVMFATLYKMSLLTQPCETSSSALVPAENKTIMREGRTAL